MILVNQNKYLKIEIRYMVSERIFKNNIVKFLFFLDLKSFKIIYKI